MHTNDQTAAEAPGFFHPLIREWFQRRFGQPTEAQARGWPAIAQRKHTLIAAPTGSGKTLAAFLTCLDDLVRRGLDGALPERTQVVYVSPLKALSNDIHRNLEQPLEEIKALAEERGTPLPEIRVAVRTGDTPAAERARMAKLPPHILITTPESLYILLTSASGRQALGDVRTLILDELHAVAQSKRGSHLALSVERLGALVEGNRTDEGIPLDSLIKSGNDEDGGTPPREIATASYRRPRNDEKENEAAEGLVTRIGLSATQRPMQEVAKLLVGNGHLREDGTADCAIVDTGHRRDMDLELELFEGEIGPIATHEQWAVVLDRIAELVQQHGTTLVFVNTRRLVERVAHQLSQRIGEEAVVAHHGSLSQRTRHEAERRLK